MAILKRTALAVLAMLATGAASAEDDWAQKAINNPADSVGIWGTAKLEPLTDASAPGGRIKRITISPQPQQPWDVGAYVMVTKPVKKDDVLLLAIWIRAQQIPAQNDFIATRGSFTQATPPNTVILPETQLLIGKTWKLHYLTGTADKDYPAGTLSAAVLLGTGEQVVDFGPAFVLDYGRGYDATKLPHN